MLNVLEACRSSCSQLRHSLEVSSDATASDRLRLRVDLLREELVNCQGIKPEDYFVIGRESLLASVGLIVTYFLVLFQFNFFGQFTNDFGALTASLVLSATPVVVLYFSLQRYIIQGIAAGAVKG